MGLVSPIEEDVYLEESGFRRKKFVYDKRVHHSYIFVAGGEVYTVVFGSIKDEKTFQKIGYSLEPGMAFPHNGMSEVYFDIWIDRESFGDFRHVKFKGLAGGVVLEQVALAMLQHYQTFDIGGFVFQAASGGVADIDRKTSLEETYDYILGLKHEQRYNKKTGLPKGKPRKLLPDFLKVYKDDSTGRACYAVTSQ
ncbi:hypothetical protein D4N06_20470 [Klebsiella pneumoniae]|uniref:Uncharacterized protein n=3 Tax=Klebsiella pneumoniae complex TaxID=3390273 RepID=A0A486R8F1_KLEPN|nr:MULTISPECIES: hypothetical protein [Klebsiella]AVO98606.1 hypothetical protein AM475_28030 [Klebsiella pneumoniae subsp. ozaenae]ECH9336925.1 hypothetical protein [Salmonella enterica subsp. enterica]ELA1890868.1 hypothetical protein [Klebsiella aerogenes]AXZ16894.1 hypothetical protein AM476_01275 [Klebsiella pneumoniae]EIW8629457.1 hypothetical protein [Klebsiella pneumoniae]